MSEFTPSGAATTSPKTSHDDAFDQLQRRLQERREQFRSGPATPHAAYELEKDLKGILHEFGREILENECNRLEPDDKRQAAPRVRYHKQIYRLNKKTKALIATTFGPVTLWSFLYLSAEDGEPGLHPLHVQLGIEAGSTLALGERAARWAVDFSQQEVRALLQAEHGLPWSNDKLRAVLRAFRRGVVAFRQEAQVARVRQWLVQAGRSRGRQRPVLAVGRDGVMVPIRGQGYQEASAATVSVYDRRQRRLGTVYLGQMPEKHQGTMTQELTDLVKAVLQQWSGPKLRLVYLTDKGQAQDDYYRRVLRRMRDPRSPRRRLAWEWVVDFFHVCGYVGKLGEALFRSFTRKGQGWFRRMRNWLRHRHHGVAQILRSAMQHYHRRRLSKAEQAEFWKAYRYLRRHQRWMDYPRYRRQGLAIGSGVTEAACKTVFTQRLKRSGMRWHKESGQLIVDLRVLHLSGIWEAVVCGYMKTFGVLERIPRASYRPPTRKTIRKTA